MGEKDATLPVLPGQAAGLFFPHSRQSVRVDLSSWDNGFAEDVDCFGFV